MSSTSGVRRGSVPTAASMWLGALTLALTLTLTLARALTLALKPGVLWPRANAQGATAVFALGYALGLGRMLGEILCRPASP